MATAKILVVEDEILIAREIEDCLCDLGYDVVGIASNAQSALQQIVKTQPDLVLMDIVIQGDQDGVTVAEQVRDRFHIPVIYLTAYADDKTLERAKRTSPFGYILKPFNKRDLRVAVEIALFRRQSELAENRIIAAEANGTGANGAVANITGITATDIPSQPFEYLSILSHELRNPLSVIKCSSAMLGDDTYPLDEAKKQQLLQRIQAATNSMNQLIEDVLTLGHTEHHSTPFNSRPINIIEFCQMLIESFQWNTAESCTIEFFSTVNSMHALVDEKLLWHLLNNLLSNAIKYSPEGGIVILRFSCTEKEICFEVQDQGIGIHPQDLEQLFQPFHRGMNVGKLPGTGLGLAIAKRVADLHNGHIAVESQIGQGTTFFVKLPGLVK